MIPPLPASALLVYQIPTMEPGRLARWLAAAALAVGLHTSVASADPPYRANVNRWHDASRVPAARFTEDGRQILRVFSVNGLGVAEVTPRTPDGGFDEEACTEVSRVLGDSRAQRSTGMDRRLIEILYQVARHFHAGQITVISGFRAQRQPSNHRLGRAMDILVPGVADGEVAAYARTLGFVGVGLYPVGGFTHIDVRTRSYFWVDRSGPGDRACRRDFARQPAQGRRGSGGR